ncbi:MAG: SAM-dependent methyltransferase, partial [Parasphingopyxis sp.]
PPIHLVETSRVLRDSQAARLPTARWHDDIDSLPDTGPLLIVANEFFDALPIRQLVRGEVGWRELMVDHADGGFTPVAGGPPLDAIVPEELRDAPPGSVLETSPAVQSAARALAERIAEQGGAALIVDYGYEGPTTGDSLQAVSGHAPANIFAIPGESDLTAHVDFALLEGAGKDAGTQIFGPIAQGDFLRAIGIEARTSVLARSAPGRREELIAARDRLIDPKQMGTLFRTMALVSRNWPEPAGF